MKKPKVFWVREVTPWRRRYGGTPRFALSTKEPSEEKKKSYKYFKVIEELRADQE